jgi:hypothetical protein
MRLLGLRARRPAPFAPQSGGYEPVDAGPGGCAYVRGGQVLTVVELPRRQQADEPRLADPPNGRWRNVITGVERSLHPGERVSAAVGEYGFAVYERV